MAQSVALTINNRRVSVSVDDPNMPLLYDLRNDFRPRGPCFGCGLAQCGACTVHIDGQAVRHCASPISIVANRSVVTNQERRAAHTLWNLTRMGGAQLNAKGESFFLPDKQQRQLQDDNRAADNCVGPPLRPPINSHDTADVPGEL
jgi:2Fe-2S iron-sulfur cluster binding domain